MIGKRILGLPDSACIPGRFLTMLQMDQNKTLARSTLLNEGAIAHFH